MSVLDATKMIKVIKQLDVHTCLGLECDGYCTQQCGAGGGHNTELVKFYKKKLIEIVQKQYQIKKNAYETAQNSAEETIDLGKLQCEFNEAKIYLKNILELYK